MSKMTSKNTAYKQVLRAGAVISHPTSKSYDWALAYSLDNLGPTTATAHLVEVIDQESHEYDMASLCGHVLDGWRQITEEPKRYCKTCDKLVKQKIQQANETKRMTNQATKSTNAENPCSISTPRTGGRTNAA